MEDLAKGFRFFPTEEELVSFYLQNKLQGERQDIDSVIPLLDIYQYNPWDLPKLAGEVCRRDSEQWFFFSPMQEREARGGKTNRLTTVGYWKATGSPGYVYSSDNRLIGGKRTMVFYKGRACNGIKTKWKLNEYKAVKLGGNFPPLTHAPPKLRQELSLCRIYYKSTSLRAFDRRPNLVATSPQTTVQATGFSSTSGGQNHAIKQRTSFEGSWPASSNEEDVSSHSQSQPQPQPYSIGSGKWNLTDIF